MRGLSYTYSGNFEKAIEDCNQALRISPNYADAYLFRPIPSLVLAFKEAHESFEKALTLYQQQGNFTKVKEIEAKVKEFDELFNFMMAEMRR